MNLDEAIAVWLYLKDSPEGWTEPGKSARKEAWRKICEYAQKTIAERAPNKATVVTATGEVK